jgi:hypothetical protein
MPNAFTIIVMVVCCINISLFLYGQTSQLDSSAMPINGIVNIQGDGTLSGINSSAQNMLSPGSWGTSTSGTADTGFNFIDVINILKSPLTLLINMVGGPIALGVELQFPTSLTLIMLLPMSILYWVSIVMLIRGMNA